MTAPVLYVMATPIGNLQDITRRAESLLRRASVIAAEDTRVARRLLAGLNIPLAARLLSARAQNEQRAAQALIAAALSGERVVYVSDAGTPAISDPGAGLARAARAAGVNVVAIPGACAFAALLSVAGLDDAAAPLHFYGFPPAAAARRRALFQQLRAQDGYAVFYEAPHRVTAMLADLRAAFGDDTPMVIGRELTKQYEQVISASLGDIVARVKAGDIPARGEFTIIAQNPALSPAAADGQRVFDLLAGELPPRRAAALAAKITGASSNELYKRYNTAGDKAGNKARVKKSLKGGGR